MIETLNSIGISNAMITSTVITIVIALIAFIMSRNLELVPNGVFQNAIEMGIEKLHNFFYDIMGEHACKKYFPFIATLFIYILICNYSGLLPLAGSAPGFAPPTSSINFPLAMAIVIFFLTQYAGVKANHGPKFFLHLFKPFAFLFPIMLIEQFVRPLSLTLRLYGNIYGEEAVVHAFFNLIPIGLPVVMQFLSVLMGLVQALVFSLLSAIYISEAVETADHL
jgi:F-type H+-transporting ATPase subunit a